MIQVRGDFPLLASGTPPLYFDSAATALKPRSVIDAVGEYYREYSANVHRGTSPLSVRASEAFENARARVRDFLDAPEDYEIIFTSGTTDGINMLCLMYEDRARRTGEPVRLAVSEMDHHSVFVPFRTLAARSGGTCGIIRLEDSGQLSESSAKECLQGCGMLGITAMSNVTGICPDLAYVRSCVGPRARIVVDGAQYAAHFKVSLRNHPADAFVFSGHKLCGPTGTGVLCIKKDWLSEFTPLRSGGGTVKNVTLEKIEFEKSPEAFEAGTPNIAGIIGLERALAYLQDVGFENIQAHERALRPALLDAVSAIPGIRYVGDPHCGAAALVSFVSDAVHAQDISFLLQRSNIHIRIGHLCAQPLLSRFNCGSVARVSCYFYNTLDEIAEMKKSLAALRGIVGNS